MSYRIIRFYQDDRPSEIIETHGPGWFDGYNSIKMSCKSGPRR